MSVRVQCPVCHYDHISEDRESCPQCNADLECFRLLEKLSDSQPETSSEDSENTGSTEDHQLEAGERIFYEEKHSLYHEKTTGVLKIMLVLLGITVIVLFIYIAYRFSIVGDLMQQQKEGLVRVIASLDNYSQKDVQVIEIPTAQDSLLKHDIETLMNIIKTNANRLDRIETQISDIKLPQNIVEMITRLEEPCFKIYRVQDGDTLWGIARDLYSSGFLYPVLLVHNPDIYIYNISTKAQLRYLCDPSQAAMIYKNATGKKQNNLYWKYMVRPGDTRSEIAKRYCPNNKSDKTKCFIDDTPLEPGKNLGIYLE
jgi:hypothetical protein